MSRPTSPITRRRMLAAAALLMVSGCASTGSHTDDSPPHWDYDADGPAHWAELDGRYRMCGTGAGQSPIDLGHPTRVAPADHIEIGYGPVRGVEIVDNGHTIQANIPAGAGQHVTVDGRRFALTQFHFHAPSEHTVDGVGADMELHLVHVAEDGAIAVLGVLMQVAEQGAALLPVLGELPPVRGSRLAAALDPRTLLPGDLAQFRYTGSLTTPPCTEGVAWTVLRHPVPVARDEVERYLARFPHTNRPAQSANGRAVVLAGG
ncbi:carbonic anhydrase [Nocardia harenae]|uniref:carbonic anhydrase n=1 Tax=Nocardia harenae TaxID=358707 RepID=UPI00082D043A|nr:carbonic anhydrase family protein [Nocardia harenae]